MARVSRGQGMRTQRVKLGTGQGRGGRQAPCMSRPRQLGPRRVAPLAAAARQAPSPSGRGLG
jgi:hypothetical protein